MDINNPMTVKTLDALGKWRHVPEVAQFLNEFYADFEPVDSRLWHYMKRKYQDERQELAGPDDIDRLFEQVLTDKEAMLYRPGERYHVVSSDQRWIAVVDSSGLRVSLMIAKNVKRLGEPLWKIRDLIS